MTTPSLTTKQIEILTLLYTFRFLNRHHLQILLHHKDPRRLQSWLNDLLQKDCIGRIYSKTFGENTKPAIYYLSKNSIHTLKDQKDVQKKLLNKIYREKLRSKVFIDHSLLIADIYVHLLKQTKENNFKLHFFTKTSLEEHPYVLRPLPDAYIAIEENGTIKRYFLEIINPETPRFVIRKRIEQYFEYQESSKWQNSTNHLFPSILLICPDESTKRFLNKLIAQTLEDDSSDISFYLTTKEAIKMNGMKKEVLHKAE